MLGNAIIFTLFVFVLYYSNVRAYIVNAEFVPFVDELLFFFWRSHLG